MEKMIHILDCTLRDGGYVNNWEFDGNTAIQVINSLYASGVRCIEIGILGKGGKAGGTKFSSFKDMEPLLKGKKMDCRYAVMVTQADADQVEIPVRHSDMVDIIRIAFFKNELRGALSLGEKLLQKGYEVFLQPMATFMYTREELEEMLRGINQIRPKAVYLVDSFSNLYPKDVRRIADRMLLGLEEGIAFGFHAHNNIQLAFANVIEFLDSNTTRELYVDGSIYGMGRGAGNVPLELLMEYQNKQGAAYDIPLILKAYQDFIRPVFEKLYWGYEHSYYLTASKSINSVYGWYFSTHGIKDILQMEKALNRISEEDKYTLIRSVAENILGQMKDNKTDI
ncbi:MAG: hypothetical protein K2N63_15920 [Lachnospiraceae bacterium]|nr:hypothetical protein [Lachnospiraceae bacterium]